MSGKSNLESKMKRINNLISRLGCLGIAGLLVLVVVSFSAASLGLLAFAGIIEFTNPGGEQTKPIPDADQTIVIPVFDKSLDGFRSEWNIYGRFESWPALLPLAQLSEAAYGNTLVVEQEAKRLGFDQCLTVDSPFHSQVAYIASGDDVAVVVFRGTDDTEDWFVNANMYLHDLPVGEIHTGFAGAYGMLQARIVDELARLKPKHLWITGHSLGGAMALTCAVDMVEFQKRDIDGVITFGQPKIGREDLTTYLQDKIGDRYVHFANERDAVPFLPNSFSHCGCLLRFFKGKVQKSSNYFAFASTGAGADLFSDEIEYEPIEELPPIDPQLYEQFKQTYDGEKDAQAMMDGPFGAAPGATDPPVVGAIPWKEDHSMTLYVEKIQRAIDQAKTAERSSDASREINRGASVP